MKLAGIVELATIPQSVQQISYFPIKFYESLKVQNRMCELCTFSQNRTHMLLRYFNRKSPNQTPVELILVALFRW